MIHLASLDTIPRSDGRCVVLRIYFAQLKIENTLYRTVNKLFAPSSCVLECSRSSCQYTVLPACDYLY
jgi:hypothetical protein